MPHLTHDTQPQEEQLKNVARRLFASQDGKTVMAALKARTIERSTLPSATTDGQAMGMLMALREGENNLYRWLEALSRPNVDGESTQNTTIKE